MSTLKNNITAQRIALLATQGEQIFHAKDLANLWCITNNNTLKTTLKRYAQNAIIYRIYKGLYSLMQSETLDPILLGAKSLHQFCYLSTETVLYQAGIISHSVDPFTFVSSQSRTFTMLGHRFISRQLATHYLYKPYGIILKNGVQCATPLRAIADLLYFNPYYHFDAPINWNAVRALQKKIGYPLTPSRYDSSKTN